jgi:RHS repeat-associated protein
VVTLQTALNARAASPTKPAVSLVTAPLISPSAALSYYGTSTTHTVGLAAWSTVPPEIQAMAVSLGSIRYASGQISATQYTQFVFDYIRNSINVEFRFGLGKGGRGALIDQSGTPFDQAELMVKLLRAANVAASYQVGTITLTPQQFGAWTGFVNGLTQSTQTFSVNAQAACQFLADGGIPATVNGATSCSGLSGNLTTVTLAHIWVSANSLLYDPSGKSNTLYSGVDIAGAMGCENAGVPTCGANAQAAAMTNATTGTLAGSPTIKNINETALAIQLLTYAQNLESYIYSNLVTPDTPYPRLQNVIGGYLRNTSYSPIPTTTLPYPSTAYLVWTGDIPDQYRSTLALAYTGATLVGFGDELAGREITVYPCLPTWCIRLDQLEQTVPLAANLSVYNLIVTHPYAAGNFANETVDFTDIFAGTTDSTEFTASVDTTIILSFGDSGPSTASHYADLQQSNTAAYVDCSTSGVNVWPCAYYTDQHIATAGNFLSQQSAADQVIMNVSGTITTRHHTIGFSQGSGGSFITLDSAVSANSTTNTPTARQSAYTVLAIIDSMLEGSVYQQERDVPEGNYMAAVFHRSNFDGTAFVDIAPANMPGIASSLINYGTVRQSLLNTRAALGYEFIIPQNGTTSCAYMNPDDVTGCTRVGGDYGFIGNTSMALMFGEAFKGGAGSFSTDMANAAINTTRRGDYSLFQKKYSTVDPATGTVTLTPPADVIAGSGEFPYSLPFLRTYSSAGRVGGWATLQAKGDGSTYLADNGYDAPDSFVNARLGGAWVHNYQIAAEIANNGYEAFGGHGGLPATAAVAAIFSLFDLNNSATVDFPHKLTSAFTSYLFGSSSLMSHTVLIHKGLSTETFQKLPDNTFTPLKISQANLVQTGGVTGTNAYFGAATINWGRNYYSGISFTYTDGDGAKLSFNQCQQSTSVGANWCTGKFPASSWAFPTGANVSFAYPSVALTTCTTQNGNPYSCGGGVTTLTSVTNNLGRSLTFSLIPSPAYYGSTFFFQITKVTTDSGQVANYSTSGCATQYFETPLCNFFAVTTPDTAQTQYGYAAGADSPDPTIPYLSQNYRLRREFFPTMPPSGPATYTLAFDQKNRLSTITDSLANVTTYDPGGLYAEIWRRADVIDATGSVSTSYFDDGSSLFSSIDGLGRITNYAFDLSRRKITTTYPETNFDSYIYDIRSNLRITTRNAVPGGVSWGPLTTMATYNEAPTVITCVHPATCNKKATETTPPTVPAPSGAVTTYSYLATGQLQRTLGPAVTAQAGGISGNAQTDRCYTTISGISLLTGDIRKVSSSVNRVTSYAYNNVTNHLTLKSVTEDPATTLVPPLTAGNACTTAAQSNPLALVTGIAYDSSGNVSSVTDPLSNISSYIFDAQRRLTTIAAPLGYALTRYCYDPDGRLTSTNRALAMNEIDLNAATAATSGQCPNSYVDANPGWQSENRTYFTNGNPQTVTDANGNQTVYAYDPDNRQQVVQDGDGRQNLTLYDAAGEVVALGRGGHTWINPNTGLPSGAWPATWSPAGYVNSGPLRYAAYSYFLNGELEAVTDAGNDTTTYTYDGFDRRTRVLYADNLHEDFYYTTDGTPATLPCSADNQPCEKFNRAQNIITYAYDAMDRKVIRTPQLEGGYTYGYDLMSEPTKTIKLAFGTAPTHNTVFSYDHVGRKSSETNDSSQVSYKYDADGNRTQLTWPDGYYVSYQFDVMNRMTKALQNGSTELAYYNYDPLSRRNYLCLGGQSSACQTGGGTNKTSYTYEADSDISSLTQTLNTGGVTLNYGHNHSHQITTLTASDNFYLPVPLAAATTYTVGVINQYSAVGGNTMANSTNGNLTTLFPTSGKQTFGYDSENRLISAAVNGGATASNFYDYDALDRRVTKTVGGTALNAGGITTQYLLDGDEEIAELISGAVALRYIPGPSTDDRIAVTTGSSTTNPTLTYFHVNHEGSVMEMTDGPGNDGATGNCPIGVNCIRLAYDEYGFSPSAPAGVAYRYTGRYFDAETGLYFYRARYYGPQVGRFLQMDPVGYASDVNAYTYVSNDPLNQVDPAGTEGDDFKWDSAVKNAGATVVGASTSQTFRVSGKPQVTPTPGHDVASMNMAAGHVQEAQAAGRTVDSVHFNQAAGKATNGDVSGPQRPDSIVRSTDPEGIKHIALGEVTAGKSGQTVANQMEKLNRIGETAAPGVKVSVSARGFNALGKLLTIIGIGMAGFQLATNPEYHAADAVQDVSPIPIPGAY